MAYDAFLKLDGIDGEVAASGYEKWIEIFSFSWGASNAGTAASGSGGGAGKVSFQDIHFTSAESKASPLLFLKCATGEHIPTGTLALRKAGGDANGGGSPFLQIKLVDVLVSSFHEAGAEQGDDRPLEDVSLNFSKIDMQYTAPDGSVVEAGWDVRANSPFAP
jgi:type VI secretion system secreted protein Hcp